LAELNNGIGTHGTYRIGVDARQLSTQLTGIGRYNLEILSRLVQMGHEWYLYSHREIELGKWGYPNVHVRTARLSHTYLRMLWSQSVMPWWAYTDQLDLFWSPLHRLPVFLPEKMASVVTIHDLVWKHSGDTMRPINRWLDSRLMPEAVRKSDRVIAVSASTARDIEIEMPFAYGKVRTIPLGNSVVGIPQPRAALSELGLDVPYFLFVGTLEPRKNLGRLLEAFSRLSTTEVGGALLAIAGGVGWGGVDVDDLIHQWGLQGRVRKLGYVSDQKLATLYAHALFLAMPSLYEGFGLPILEALSRGVPVLTSDNSSMPEVAGAAALLVSPDSVDSISNGVATLLGDNVFRLQLASRAVAIAARFNWDQAALETMATFEEAIAVRHEKIASKYKFNEHF
jgi:glycosyltransferase involved in cell wall biosynthesis